MKKYEKPRFETFKVGLSSGAGFCKTGSSPDGNQCGNGTMALDKKCQGGGLAGGKCQSGDAPDKKCQVGSSD